MGSPFHHWLQGAAVLALAASSLHQARAQPAVLPSAAVCDVAGAEAERRHELPSGLLRAIGRVESGRRDPATGRVAAWPWTINAEGRGSLFDSQAEALTTTRALQQGGTASIDVGCFQVNLLHHPTAFATLEEGFDPARNADYAARFLQTLRAKTGTWDAAVAAYHSAVPERGNPYRDRVMAGWARDGADPAVLAATPSPAASPGLVVRMVNWSPPAAAGGMRVWTPSAPGQGAAVIVMRPPGPGLALAPPRLPRG